MKHSGERVKRRTNVVGLSAVVKGWLGEPYASLNLNEGKNKRNFKSNLIIGNQCWTLRVSKTT
jgi:hypothetical protein